jgi:preprotein translocase subunit SecD
MKKLISLIAACLLVIGASAADNAPAPVLQMRLIAEKPDADSEQMSLVTTISGKPDRVATNHFNIQKTVLLDQTALKSADVVTNTFGNSVIEITFSKTGASQFATVTRENIGRQLGIIIDGTLRSAPFIRSSIDSGKAQISGSFTKAEAQDLARKINASIPNSQ